MIELHLIEDKIFYGVVEEFLFTCAKKNTKRDCFYNGHLTRFISSNLSDAIKYMVENKSKINKSIIIKYQETDGAYKHILKIYSNLELDKYLILL